MTISDDEIRRALALAVPPVRPVAAADLRSSIDDRIRRHRRRRRALPAVAAACFAILVGIIVVGARHDEPAVVTGDPGSTAPTTTPAPSSTFAGLGAGWHDLDPGPVPASASVAAAAWTGRELVVVAGGPTFAYDPSAQTWRALPPLPFDPTSIPSLVWTGHVLVAVEGNQVGVPAHAAVLDPTSDGAWTPIDGPPLAAGLLAVGSLGPGAVGDGHLSLVWTGQRVVDVTHGAVLDVDTHRWSALALPADLVRYTNLLATNPVWDGSEVVAVSATFSPGLAWDAMGRSYRELPGIPVALLGRPSVAPVTRTASPTPGVVVAVGGFPESPEPPDGPSTNTFRLDVGTGTWTELPKASQSATPSDGCPYALAAVDDRLVLSTCRPEIAVEQLGRDGWTSTGGPDLDVRRLRTVWLTAGGALVSWSVAGDQPSPADPQLPAFRVWVP